jgi:hypothetical protein
MRDFLKTGVRLGRTHWFWPLALLTLPNCSFHVNGLPSNFKQSDGPYNSVIFCDIEEKTGRHCPVSQAEIDSGVPLAAAATALATGRTSDHALDFSPDALARCAGKPEVVTFAGPFPEGFPVCMNCSADVGPAKLYPDEASVCQTKCWDLNGSDVPPTADTTAFCAAHASISTNFAPTLGSLCLDGACLDAGTLRNDFVDPRRPPDPVIWGDLIGTATSGIAGNTLTRSAATTGNFDAGAASTELITKGDAYVEFTANETNTARLGGLSEGPPPDNNPDFISIGWAIDLFKDGCVYIFESGVKQPGSVATCATPQAFAGYMAGQKFRVNVTDNNDAGHTATISYALVTASCSPGMPCPTSVLYTSPTPAHYPLRVDSSFREQGGTLGDVNLVRIH